MPVYKHVNKQFFKKWSHKMAYVLGFWAADGYITVGKRGSHYLGIQIIDLEILEKMKSSLLSEHKISVREKSGNESTIYRLQIGSKDMCDDLRKLGLHENKSHTMRLPVIPKKYFGDFVRGYFDGDGNVWVGYLNKKRKIPTHVISSVFTSCSKEFLEDLHKKLKEIGLQGGGVYSKKNAFCSKYSINDSILLFHLMYDNLQSELFLQRKKKVFEEYIKMRT